MYFMFRKVGNGHLLNVRLAKSKTGVAGATIFERGLFVKHGTPAGGWKFYEA